VLGDPNYATGLADWLTADYHPVEMLEFQARRSAQSIQTFEPASEP
jgi:hypothetical protein